MDASSHTGHTHVALGKPPFSLSLSVILHTMGSPKAFPTLRGPHLETLGPGLGSSHPQDKKTYQYPFAHIPQW